MSVFLIFCCGSYKEKIKKYLIETYKEMKWNGVIRAITISFLKLSLTFSVKIKCEETKVYSNGILVYNVLF